MIDCKTAVFFANASDGPYSKERLERVKKPAWENGERRALHTRGSRLRHFPPSENDCFAVSRCPEKVKHGS